MGFNTWISIQSKPLKNRINIILTKDKKKVEENRDNIYVFDNFPNLFCWLVENKILYNKIFIIGGSSIFNQILEQYRTMINNIYITEVDNKYYTKEKYNLSYFNDSLQDFSFSEIEKLNLTNESLIYNVQNDSYQEIDIKYKFLLGVQKEKIIVN